MDLKFTDLYHDDFKKEDEVFNWILSEVKFVEGFFNKIKRQIDGRAQKTLSLEMYL